MTSFTLVQRAWCEQLPAESRKVMADGIWLRHRTQIEEMAAALELMGEVLPNHGHPADGAVAARVAREAQARGFDPSHFSFNLPGGRCEVCQGDGTVTVEMQFLADVELVCEECGRRYPVRAGIPSTLPDHTRSEQKF